MLDEEEIKNIIINNPPAQACEKLVAGAISNGGEDNITVIVIKNE